MELANVDQCNRHSYNLPSTNDYNENGRINEHTFCESKKIENAFD